MRGEVFKFISYITLKWILFWGYQFFESGEKSNWNWDKVNSMESMVYTFGMFLIFPILEIIFLMGPFYLALKKDGWMMIGILVLVFVLEFAIGWFATNQKFALWMVVKLALSIGLFFLFYRKQMKF
jgi:hypothetical protein